MKDFKDLHILVIGDIILDQYVDGSVTRISPEAPIIILDKQQEYYRLGGASNVSKNLASLGVQTYHMGQVGFDWHGDLVKIYFKEAGIKNELVYQNYLGEPPHPTSLKTRFTSGNTQLLRVDYEDKTSIENTEIAAQMEDFIFRHLHEFDAVIISDYQKGIVYPKLAEAVIHTANVAHIPVIVDTHKKNWACFKNCTCITPNRKELEAYVGRKLPSILDVAKAGEEVRAALTLSYLLVTLSEEGMLLIEPTHATPIPAEPTKVVDVTGCGDTAIAVFTTLNTCGQTPLQAAQIANHAASVVCEKMGTAAITPKELS